MLKKLLSATFYCLLFIMTVCLLSSCVSNTYESVPTVTWYMRKPVSDMSRQQLVEERANKIIQKEIGVKLKFEFIDSGAWDSKINAMIVAGEEFDLILDMGASFVNNVRKNAYLDVKDYVERFGSDIITKLDDFAWKAVDFDGKYYGIPSQTFYVPYSSFAFKKDLTDKYDFEYSDVDSYDKLEPFLKLIRDNEVGMYPMVAAATADFPQPQSTEYLRTDMDYITYDRINDQFIPDYESPHSIERYRCAYDFFNKDYIAKDASSKNEVTAEIKSGKYAVFPGRRSATKTSNLYGFECVESEPTYGSISANNISNSITAVSRTSSHPEKAVELLNLIWKDSYLSNLLAYGIENMDYTVVSENDSDYFSIVTNSGNNVKWSVWHNWLGPLWDQWDSPWNSRESLEEMKKLNESAPVSPILGFRPNLDEFTTELAVLGAIYAETRPILNTGSMPDFDRYISIVTERYKEAGIDSLIAEIERQYDEWKANN